VVVEDGDAAVTVATASKTCNSLASVSAYFAQAIPQTLGSSGQRSFATDTRGTVFFDSTGGTFANPIVDTALALQ
jgi:hypothetical protein